MPKQRTGAVEMALSASQERSLIDWADATPGFRNWRVLQAKLKEMGVDAEVNAVRKYLADKIEPGLQQQSTIANAAKYAKEIGKALRKNGGRNFARATNMLHQQAAFEWAKEQMERGRFDLDDPEFVSMWVKIQSVVESGMVAEDRQKITNARVRTLEQKLKAMEAKEEETKADLANPTLTMEERAARMRARFGM